jgi:hypothetical protein
VNEAYGNPAANVNENGVYESAGIVILPTLRTIFIFSLVFSPYANTVRLFHGRVNEVMCRLLLV